MSDYKERMVQYKDEKRGGVTDSTPKHLKKRGYKKKKANIVVEITWIGVPELDIFKEPLYSYFNRLEEAYHFIEKEKRSFHGKYYNYEIVQGVNHGYV